MHGLYYGQKFPALADAKFESNWFSAGKVAQLLRPFQKTAR